MVGLHVPLTPLPVHPSHPNARTTAGWRPAVQRLALVSLAALGVALGAAACNDSAARRLTALSPNRGLSHDDSLRMGISPSLTRSASLVALDACDPIDPSCPSVASFVPGNFMGFSQPNPIRINFSGPVRVVTVVGSGAVTCDGTFGTITGYNAAGAEVGHADLALINAADCSPPDNPDNVTFGVQGSLETTTIMAYAVVTPPSLLTFPVYDLVGHASQRYSVTVSAGTPPELGIRISRAGGPNGLSFTYASAERKIFLDAELTPADPIAKVTWEVIDAPGDRVAAIPPAQPPTGQHTSFSLPKHDKSRWPTDHPGAMDRKTIKYQVTAIVEKDGQMVRSEPVIVSQDLVDTIREEYFEFGLASLGRHIPGRGEFTVSPPVFVGDNNGDYELAVLEPKFLAKLAVLKASWKGKWQVNTIYRNPVHNLNGHIVSNSKPSSSSWHMWGCAADLQTFPQDGSKAQYKFWHELNDLAVEQGWDTESLGQAKVGHVHVELDCP